MHSTTAHYKILGTIALINAINDLAISAGDHIQLLDETFLRLAEVKPQNLCSV